MALLSRTSILAPRSACFPGYHAKAAFPAVGKLSICRAVDKDLDEADNGGLHPMLEMAVPSDQRPVNELRKLKESQLSSWVLLDTPDFLKRFAIAWGGFFMLISGPISAQTFDPTTHLSEFIAGASFGSFLAVSTVAVRLYLTWSYVGQRLLSATVEYEETGWYDGQVFVKPPEVLARDRLLGTYEVRPILGKLRVTLIACASALVVSSGSLLWAGNSLANDVGGPLKARVPAQVSANGVVYSKTRKLADFLDDPEAAREEAEAQGGVPGYCGDRYFRAFAGGTVCKKFD